MISPSGEVNVLRGKRLSFNCTREGSSQSSILLLLNDVDVHEAQNVLMSMSIPNGAAILFGPVTTDHNGSRLRCEFLDEPQAKTAKIILNVLSKYIYKT